MGCNWINLFMIHNCPEIQMLVYSLWTYILSRKLFNSRKQLPLICLLPRRGFQLLQESRKVGLKIRRKGTKSTRTRSIRSTSIIIKIEAKTEKRIKRKIKVRLMILVLIPPRNTTKRKGNMMEMMILTMCTNTKEVSTRAQKLMNWGNKSCGLKWLHTVVLFFS